MKNHQDKIIILVGLTLTLGIFFLPFGAEVDYQGNSNNCNFFYQEILKVKSFWKILIIGISLCSPLILSLEITQKEKLHFENFPQKIFALFQFKIFLYGFCLAFPEIIFYSMSKVYGRLTIVFLLYFLSAIIGIGWTVGQLFKNHSWWED